jgi:hypothetical protein
MIGGALTLIISAPRSARFIFLRKLRFLLRTSRAP